MSLHAEQMSIATLLSGDRQYLIPNFQRPYSWEFDQAYQLVEDLTGAWLRGDDDYFLGSLVVVHKDERGRTVEVIDGQQRLTTLTLMIAVLRHYFVLDEKQQAELSDLLDIPANTILDVSGRTRVRVRDKDQEFYAQYVVNDDLLGLFETTPEQRDTIAKKRIKQNVEAIREALAEALDGRETIDFLKFFLARVLVVVVSTPNHVNAHRIFGVLNTRGVPLTASDILKARVLGEVKEADRDRYAERWDRSIEVQEGEPDEFFHHLLVALTKNPSKRALLDEYETAFDRKLAQGGTAFVDEVVVPYAEAHRTLNGNSATSEGVSRQLYLLRQYQSRDWKPAAMWILVNLADDADRESLLRGLERLFGVLVVGRQGSEVRGREIARVLRALSQSMVLGEAPDVFSVMSVDDSLKRDLVFHLKSELANVPAVRKLLLTRAHLAAGGVIESLPRSFSAVSLLTSGAATEVDQSIDVARWKSRLGGLLLTRAKQAGVTRIKTLVGLQKLLLEEAIDGADQAVDVPHLAALTEETLRDRHETLVALIAAFWSVTRDGDGVDLTRLTEQQLARIARGFGTPRRRRIRLAEVVNVGIISVGDVFLWRHANNAEADRVVISESGRFRLPNGKEVDSPSATAVELTGGAGQALDNLVRESDGRPLRDMWQTFERRFATVHG